jgi:DNA-binding response OmpR family regulator
MEELYWLEDPMDSMLSVAVVEDHRALNEIFVDYLIGCGHRVYGCFSAEDLDELFAAHSLDLLILDVNLPGEDGFGIASRYRNAYPSIGIIMLTVKAHAKDKIHGYESGADLYLPKPVSSEELAAAVMSFKRRLDNDPLNQNVPKLDVAKRVLSSNLLRVTVSQQLLPLLKGLIEAPNQTLEYWQLLELMDKEVNDISKASLTVYIHRLNKKLESLGIPNPAIQVVWKSGYQLTSKIIIV